VHEEELWDWFGVKSAGVGWVRRYWPARYSVRRCCGACSCGLLGSWGGGEFQGGELIELFQGGQLIIISGGGG